MTRPETVQLSAASRDGGPTPASGRAPLAPGVVLDGRYLLQAQLGAGGMGAVWRAEHVRIGRPVAVKVLHPEVSSSPHEVERFRREALIAVQLSSPHVVEVLDFGETHDRALYLVMELLEGESLRDRLHREERLAPGVVADLMRQLLRGLDAAHRAGVVHRDLKPENLWIVRHPGGGERLKILDFGIAKLAAPAPGSDQTQTGLVVGTPQFLSPEQAVGGEVDARAGDPEVVRLEVAVDDARRVRGAEPVEELAEEPHRALGGEPPLSREPLAERLALEQLHHDEGAAVAVLAEVEDLDDVRRPEPHRDAGLAPEPLALGGAPPHLRVEQLHRRRPADLDVLGAVDRPHAPGAEQRDEPPAPVEHAADVRLRRVQSGEPPFVAEDGGAAPRPRGPIVAVHARTVSERGVATQARVPRRRW